jgi:hypothetical protein
LVPGQKTPERRRGKTCGVKIQNQIQKQIQKQIQNQIQIQKSTGSAI